jgi:hypothetical protein
LAGLALSGLYLLITIIAAITAVVARRINQRRAEEALQARKAAFASSFLSGGIAPTLLSAGLNVGQTIGWRRIVMLVGVALLTAGVAREWTAREAAEKSEDEPSHPNPDLSRSS